MTKNALKLLSFLTLCLVPLSLAAGDPNPDNTPSCAPKKPVAARARKIVRPDAGPWDNPNFVWGLAHDIPATQRAPLLLVKHVAPPAVRVDNATYQNFWQLKLGEETFQLDLANLNWAEVPDEMRNAERISYREDPRFETLWNIDQTFFSHFPKCNSVGIAGVGIPPQEALDPLKVICLRNTCSEVQSAEILASLPLFQNLRALHLDFTATARAEVGDLHPLTSLTKLQALRLGISRPWSAALCDNLKQTIQNTQLREISLETSLFKVRTNQFVCDALKDHPFHHMSILGFKIKTLAAFDVSCLKTFSLNNCGTIEEGFSEHPLHLRKLVLIRTKIGDGALNPAHLAHVETVELRATDFPILSAATSLKELVLRKTGGGPLTCLETLDILPPNENLKIKIKLGTPDVKYLRPAVERQPSLRQKIELIFSSKVSMSLDAFLQGNSYDAQQFQEII